MTPSSMLITMIQASMQENTAFVSCPAHGMQRCILAEILMVEDI